MRLLSLATSCLAVLCLSALAAHADTVTTFSFFGEYHASCHTGYAQGQVTINTTTGTLESIDLEQPWVNGYYESTDPVVWKFGYPVGPAGGEFFTIWEQWGSGETFTEYGLVLNTSTLVGYTGGDLCSLSVVCIPPGYDDSARFFTNVLYPQKSNQPFYFDFAELTPYSTVETSPTPEPSSLALLGTGVLGVMGVIRRRSWCNQQKCSS